MSDKVRELYVALSLNTTDFNKHIRAAGKQIKEAESEFRLAAAGAEDFEKTLKGMAAKAGTLKKQLEQTQKITGKYSEKLEDLNRRMAEETNQHRRLTEQIDWETQERDRLQKQVDEQYADMKRITFAYGAESDAAKAAGEQLKVYQERLKGAEEALSKSERAFEKVKGEIYNTGNAITDTETAMNNANAEIKEMEAELGKLESRWYRGGVAMQNFAQNAQGAAQSVERLGDGLTGSVTTPLIGLGAAATKATIDFESAFAGVRKTVNATGEDTEKFFSGLSDDVIDMSKRLATGANDISDVMAIAGQLGIANKELQSFTETIIRLGMSTDMAGEDAASSMARFANITGMAQDKFGKMGATLVYLGNNFATTESEIMNMAVRIAAAGKQVGLSEPQILGFSAALSSLGLEAEAGGSAFSKALKKMETAVATGSDALTDFAKVAGMTREEFSTLWKENPAAAFEAFVAGLSRMDESGIGAIATLEEIGITELRLSDTLLRTANATELLTNAQNAANTAWEEGTALIQESDTRLQTTASRLENIKNKLIAAGIGLGETMAPEIERVVNTLDGAVTWLNEMDEETRRNIVTWGLWAAAAGPAIKGLGKVGSAVSGTAGAIGKLAEGIGRANAAFKATGSVVTWISTLTGPGGLLMLGLTGAAVAAATLYNWFQKIEEAKPDFSIDTSEIEKYRIDVDALQAEIDVNTTTNVTGEILSLKTKFQTILNDGVPETTEIREGMQADISAAVGEVYKLIEESYNQKKAELDALLANGVIDETTYNTAMTTLNTQADAMKTDLTTKADAVSAYITTLCDANRKMTEEEIATLNALIVSLSESAEAAQTAANAQMQGYRLAYDKTRLGMGTAEDAKNAVAYLELTAQQEIDRLEAEKKALEAVYAASTEGMSDSEKAEEFRKLNEAQKALDQQITEIEQAKQADAAKLAQGMITEADGALEALLEWFRLKEQFEKGSLGGGDQWYNWVEWNPNRITDALGITDYAGDMEAALEKLEPYLTEGSPLMTFLATLQAQGLIPEGSLDSTESTLNTLISLMKAAEEDTPGLEETIQTAVQEANAAANEAEDGEGVGSNLMAGIMKGIRDGVGNAERTMRWAMGRIQAAAKDTMEIHSPSRVMEKEIGAQMMKGLGKGFMGELPGQEKLMANAMRHMTGEIQYGAAGSTDNRKTYNTENSVNVTVERLEVRDQQDIQTLATEIASLTRTNQRGRGVRYA